MLDLLSLLGPARRAACLLLVLELTMGNAAGVAAEAAGPRVWAASGMARIARQGPPGQGVDVALAAARGEYAPFQVAVQAPAGGLTEVSVQVSDLRGERGASIPRRCLALYREHYVHVEHPTADRPGAVVRSLGPGWYADGLIPFVDPDTGQPAEGPELRAAPVAVAARTTQPYWIDLQVPRTAPPGRYTGTYSVTSAQGQVQGSIALEVWDFELPLQPSAGSLFVVWSDRSVQAMAELARHRLAPCRCRPEEAALLVDSCGLALAETGFWSGADISHRTMSPPPTVAACRTRAAAYPPGLRLVNYTADEIVGAPELEESLRAYACSLHEAGIEQLLVAPPNRALFDDGSGSGSPAIDIWVLLGVYFDAEHLAVAREALAAGMEVWSYTTANQDDFSPKWQIDFAPVNFRALPGFINQSLGFTGVLYWAVDRWTADPWNDLSCVLDGGSYPGNAALVYPGAPVGVGGTVASMRLKWIRQGMQDYEYVELLKRSGQEATALALSRSVAQDLRVWSQDPEQYETVRRQIGRMLSVGDQDR